MAHIVILGSGIGGLCNLFSVNFRGVGHDAGVTG
jgi:hypothetical protein